MYIHIHYFHYHQVEEERDPGREEVLRVGAARVSVHEPLGSRLEKKMKSNKFTVSSGSHDLYLFVG